MSETEVNLKFIPLDKSWIIRMGILDIINGRTEISTFLDQQNNLGDDLLALKRVAASWNSGDEVDVGESGTLYRLLRFATWKLKLQKKFTKRGTLASREITDNPEIIYLPQSELLKLDNGTSQWASAAVLLGDEERLPNPPFKLKVTYDAYDHWKKQHAENIPWLPRYDETILEQAKTFIKILNNGKTDFSPQQAEDFCFAYTFGYMTAEDGEKKWPALRKHESDRIEEIVIMLDRAKSGEEITSRDHRVVQAIAMWGKVNKKEVKIKYPESVNKSWPQFWDFIVQY